MPLRRIRVSLGGSWLHLVGSWVPPGYSTDVPETITSHLFSNILAKFRLTCAKIENILTRSIFSPGFGPIEVCHEQLTTSWAPCVS